jgi:hypothetical protein
LQVTKIELLERITRSRAALEKLVNALSEAQLTAPGPEVWSVKDHLAHLAAWELGVAELLQRRNRFAAMHVEEAVKQGKSEDEVNDLIYRHCAGLSLAEVKVAFQTAHQQLVQAVEALEDADLHRPYRDYLPAGSGGPDRPVFQWIVGNTFEHFDEHRGYIQELAGKLESTH